jgi:hypothetical protein
MGLNGSLLARVGPWLRKKKKRHPERVAFMAQERLIF